MIRLRQFKATFVTQVRTYPNVYSDLIKETKLFAYIIHFLSFILRNLSMFYSSILQMLAQNSFLEVDDVHEYFDKNTF